MNRIVIILVLMPFLILAGCSKNNDDTVATSGTITINNTRTFDQTYSVTGFLFSQAKLVSTLDNPSPDITVDSDGTNLFFMNDNQYNSFYKTGEYNDAASAKSAFDNLTSATVSQWEGMATPILANQIWIYRSGSEHYAKIRVVSIVSETRSGVAYAECTFEWVYQPDGSLTFPGK